MTITKMLVILGAASCKKDGNNDENVSNARSDVAQEEKTSELIIRLLNRLNFSSSTLPMSNGCMTK